MISMYKGQSDSKAQLILYMIYVSQLLLSSHLHQMQNWRKIQVNYLDSLSEIMRSQSMLIMIHMESLFQPNIINKVIILRKESMKKVLVWLIKCMTNQLQNLSKKVKKEKKFKLNVLKIEGIKEKMMMSKIVNSNQILRKQLVKYKALDNCSVENMKSLVNQLINSSKNMIRQYHKTASKSANYTIVDYYRSPNHYPKSIAVTNT